MGIFFMIPNKQTGHNKVTNSFKLKYFPCNQEHDNLMPYVMIKLIVTMYEIIELLIIN